MYRSGDIGRLYELYHEEGILGPVRGAKRHLQYNYLRSRTYYWNRYITGPTDVREIYGSKMQLDIRKEGVNRDLIIDGEREPESIRYYASTLNKLSESFEDIIVLDIGANIGHLALLAAKSCPNSTVRAVEPDPRNVEDLSQNVRLNGYDNIRIDQLAVGAEKGTNTLQLDEQPNLNRMRDVGNDEKEFDGTVHVEVETIDSLLEKLDVDESVPVILRMDTEGYETEILKGATKLLNSDRPLYTFIELHYNTVSESDMNILVDRFESNEVTVDQVRDGPGTFEEPIGFAWDTVRPPSEYEDQFPTLHLFAQRSIF